MKIPDTISPVLADRLISFTLETAQLRQKVLQKSYRQTLFFGLTVVTFFIYSCMFDFKLGPWLTLLLNSPMILAYTVHLFRMERRLQYVCFVQRKVLAGKYRLLVRYDRQLQETVLTLAVRKPYTHTDYIYVASSPIKEGIAHE